LYIDLFSPNGSASEMPLNLQLDSHGCEHANT